MVLTLNSMYFCFNFLATNMSYVSQLQDKDQKDYALNLISLQ